MVSEEQSQLLACDLQSLSRSNYARIMFFRCHCPNSGSLILGGQIMHINEGKGKLALFSTKDNVLLTLDPSYSFPIDLLSLSNFTFYPFHFPSSTSTLHRSHIDPARTFCFNTVLYNDINREN